jgi:hypothetical protein
MAPWNCCGGTAAGAKKLERNNEFLGQCERSEAVPREDQYKARLQWAKKRKTEGNMHPVLTGHTKLERLTSNETARGDVEHETDPLPHDVKLPHNQ